MPINLTAPDVKELKPKIIVFGVGGAGGNAVNNMISCGLEGVEFVVANTDAQALASSKASRVIQMGLDATQGLGAGSQPDIGAAAAEEVLDEIRDQLSGAHMVFITGGMGGGTGTGSAPVIARAAKEMGILTVGVVTKPFQFEGLRRMRLAESGVQKLQEEVDTLIVIPNQNLFRIANEKTTFADAFALADQVLYSGVASITDLMVKEGLINLDFADVRAVMRGMGKAMMGTGESTGEKRALAAAEAAIANPLLDDVSMKGARGLLISITGGNDLTLYEVDEAATRIREEVDQEANIILGATFDESLAGVVRVSVVATGIDEALIDQNTSLSAAERRIAEIAEKLKAEARTRTSQETTSQNTLSVESIANTLKGSQQPYDSFGSPRQHDVSPQVRAAQPAPQPAMAAAPSPMPQVSIARGVLPQTVVCKEGGTSAPIQESSKNYQLAPQPAVQPHYSNQQNTPDYLQVNIDPQAVRPVRMPQIDELPIPAQNEIRASRGEVEPREENKRVSLLQRLATVGFGIRHSEEEENYSAPASHQQGYDHSREIPANPQRQAPSPVHMEYSRQAQPHPQGQPHPQAYHNQPPVDYGQSHPMAQEMHQQKPMSSPRQPQSLMDDEHLEIPAFLRRQTN